jgi:hypothetical protein
LASACICMLHTYHNSIAFAHMFQAAIHVLRVAVANCNGRRHFQLPSRLQAPTPHLRRCNASMDPCVDRPWKGTPIFGSPVLNWLVPYHMLTAHVATTWQETPAAAPKFSYLVVIKSVEQTNKETEHYGSHWQNKVDTKIGHGSTLRVLSPQ